MSPPSAPPLTAGDLLTLAELQELRTISGWRSARLVLHAWGIIALAMAAGVIWPTPVVLGLAVVVIGGRQFGLAVLLHDAVHWRLFPRPAANNGIARWLCAHPVWAELPEYRRQHHLHHRHTRQTEDPDLALAPDLPLARGALWRDLALDLCGATAVRGLLSTAPWRVGVWPEWWGPVASNAALLSALAALGHWWIYPLLWLLPRLTWYQLAVRIRNIAEHGLVGDDGDPLRNTRTVAAGCLARAILAPYWVNYHLEHHLMVFVPCWKLPRAHAILLAKGWGPRMELAPSYLDVIRRATAPR
jgi:fatty acid desaturase